MFESSTKPAEKPSTGFLDKSNVVKGPNMRTYRGVLMFKRFRTTCRGVIDLSLTGHHQMVTLMGVHSLALQDATLVTSRT